MLQLAIITAAISGNTWALPHATIEQNGQHAVANAAIAPFLKYIVFPYPSQELLDWHVWTVNSVPSDLRNTEIILPAVVDPKGMWVAWNVLDLAPGHVVVESRKKFDVVRLLGAFEGVRDDSLYAKAITYDAEVATVDSNGDVIVVSAKRTKILDPQFPAVELLSATKSTTPVLTLFEFQRAALSYQYYRFLNLPKTLNEVLEQNGWDRTESKKLLSAQRAILGRSRITRAPRAIEFLPGIGSRPVTNQGIAFLTEDFIVDKIDERNDPFVNVIEGKPDGGEQIYEGANGRHFYTLTNAKGELIEFVDNNVIDVADNVTTKARLTAGVSCIGCHMQGEFRGIQPFRKDFSLLRQKGMPLAIKDTIKDALKLNQFLSTAYNWSAGDGKNDAAPKFVARARDDLSDFVQSCTGGRMQPEDVSRVTREFWGEYIYNAVDAEKAADELGIEYEQGGADKALQATIKATGIEYPYSAIPIFGRTVARDQWNQAKRFLYPRLFKDTTNEKANDDAGAVAN